TCKHQKKTFLWPRQMASPNGLCRYGARIDCCWGWTRRSWGHCQPLFALTHRVVGIRCQPQALCQHGCKHGECVGPNKCKCFPGFTGKTCNQDLNECGLKPRPCKHRCMNTYGSYKCYCLNGYMLLPDGSCGNARTCSMANCQYGCEVVKGEVRCQCPSPGLQLGPDGRTCVDVDECASRRAVCPRFRKCVNTFGSYICKCHDGFELLYINGKYQCMDVDECALGQYHCPGFSSCYNTPGSYKCKCKDGSLGVGYDCKPIPKVSIEPPRPGKNQPNNKIPDSDDKRTATTARAPVTVKRVDPTTSIPTTAPPRRVTPAPKEPAIPTRKPSVPTRKPPAPTRKPAVPTVRPPAPTTRVAVVPTGPPLTPEVTPADNSIPKEVTQKPRGDVHIPRNPGQNNVLTIDYDIELGNTADELKDDPDAGFLSCAFDDGLCAWIDDREGDLRWETTEDPAGGKYLTIPEAGGKRSGRGARLVLPLTPPWNSGNMCLSFRHKLAGHHVGVLQVFVKKGRQHSPAVWGRTGGHGWRSTQITLWGSGLESVSPGILFASCMCSYMLDPCFMNG
uniref:Nephronectin a n=1 Tax=Scleropages formosus TaxID=113540 RepID=A0A8C9SAG2_SCLFO